jgi:hypothetical protein
MAKARIVYNVDHSELDALEKQLKEIRAKGEKVGDPLKDLPKKTKPAVGALTDLKGAIAGLGITAVVGAAIVSFAKLTEEVNKSRKQVALLTNETGKSLDAITAKVLATSKVFDKDFNEVLRAANAVSKNLGITLPETMDQINDAMSRGLDINGEYLETISEYSPFMKQAGIDFQTFNALIQKQLTDGVFSDKGIDAIKEAVLSIQEMTPVTRDALRAAGFNTEQLIREIETGAKTYFEVVQEIGTKLEEVTDPRIRGQILADVFKGAGEDAGEFALTLNEVTGAYQKLSPEAQKAKDSTDALLESTEALNTQLIDFSTNTIGIWTQAQTTFNNFATGTLRLINELINDFDGLEKKTNSLVESFGTLTRNEAESELEKLNARAEELETTIAEIDAKDEGWFSWIGDNGKKAREDLEEINLQIAVLNDLLKENETIEPDVVRKITTQKETITKQTTPDEIGSKGLDLQSVINDQRIEQEQKLQDDIANIKISSQEKQIEDQKQLDENARLESLEREKETQQKRGEIIEAGISGVLEIAQGFADLRIQQISQELTALEFARNRELELAEGNAAKKDQINQKFDEKRRALEQKQANTQKQSALFEIAINTAVAIAKALPNIPLSILAGVLGAAQAGFVLAQPVPRFAKGTLDVGGRGTGDTVHAMLTPHEAVIPVQENRDYHQAIKAIYNREISPEILNNFAKNGGSQAAVVYDYDKLAQAVMNQPKNTISMDENGFTQHLIRQNQRIRMKESKFKM